MKKIFTIIVMSLLIFSLSLFGVSCKDEVASPEEAPVEEAVEEEAPVEEAVEEEESDVNPFTTADTANIDWKQFDGQTINVMMVEHWYTDAMKPIIGDFEALTGIKVSIESFAEEGYYQKLRLAMSSGEVDPDVFMVGNLDISQFALAGWLEPVDSYINNPSLTDKEWYDYDDIFSTIKKAGTFDGEMFITGIPTAELEILYYRKDILEENGIDVPETFDELYEAATSLNTEEVSGFVTRGARGISSWWEWTGIFLSYGGRFFDSDGKAIFNTPEGVAATEMYGKLQKEAGPIGVENFTWLMNVDQFRSGSAVFCLEASGVTPLMIDPEESSIIGKIGYAQIPHAPGKTPLANYWTWALGMNATSDNKEASWLLLEWLSSKYISYETALAGGAGAVRETVLDTEAFEKAYGAEWTNVVKEGLANYVEPELIPYYMPEIFEIADEISIGLSNVLTGTETPQEAMDNAVIRVDNLLK